MLIVCNGMIRSGSTLQYNMVRSLVEKMEVGTDHGFCNPQMKGKWIGDPQIMEWGESSRFHVIKMHDIHPKVVEMTFLGTAKIVYISRDLRDVATSLKEMSGMEVKNQFERLNRTVGLYYEFKRIKDNTFCQKYEKVMPGIPSAVKEIAAFLDLHPSCKIVEAVVQECSLEKAKALADKRQKKLGMNLRLYLNRRILSKLGISIKNYDSETLILPRHVSEKNPGKIGRWREELSEQEVELIVKHFKDWFLEEGYEPE